MENTILYCVESAHIRSYSGPYFSAFGLNSTLFSISMRENTEQNNSEFEQFFCSVIDQLCFAKFLLLYYTDPKSKDCSSNDCQPVDLDNALMESNHAETKFPKIILLMPSKEKLVFWKVRAVLRYHQPSLQKHIEQYSHHLFFAFYSFRREKHLKSLWNTETYFSTFLNMIKVWQQERSQKVLRAEEVSAN